MRRLIHVEIQPFGVVEHFRRIGRTDGVKGHQMMSGVAFAEALGECVDGGALLCIGDGSIAAKDPDDWLIAIASTEKTAVSASRFGGFEDGIRRLPIFAPGGEHTDEEAEIGGFIDDEIDVAEIGGIGFLDITVDERQVAVGVGNREAAEFAQDDGLNGGEALAGAVVEILGCVFAIETVEQLLGSVAEIEERRAIGKFEIAMVGGDAQIAVRRGQRGAERKAEADELFHSEWRFSPVILSAIALRLRDCAGSLTVSASAVCSCLSLPEWPSSSML